MGAEILLVTAAAGYFIERMAVDVSWDTSPCDSLWKLLLEAAAVVTPGALLVACLL